MTDVPALLARHAPRLAYDSQEAYFADSAAIWTDSKTNVLKRAKGTTLAQPPTLGLDYLGAHTYTDRQAVLSDDVIGETTRDYAKHAAALHKDPGYRDKIHARGRRDSQGQLWLQYWFFYYYNDFQLAGPLLSGGKHEGDWEMIQIRLDANDKPVEAVFAQHTNAERHDWSYVTKQGTTTPVVYVARGSHASYFRAGTHWTGAWWDNADGKGPAIAPALIELKDPLPGWALWPGFWGDTKATSSPIDSSSPRGPVGHAQWSDPLALLQKAKLAAPPPAPPPKAPKISASTRGGKLVISYDAPHTPTALVVGIRPRGSDAPATLHPVEVVSASGELEIPDAPSGPLDIAVHTAAPGGVTSPAARTRAGR